MGPDISALEGAFCSFLFLVHGQNPQHLAISSNAKITTMGVTTAAAITAV